MVGNLIAAKWFTFGQSKTWAEVATITAAEEAVTVPGLRVGDFVLVEKPTHQAGLGYVALARVTANDELTIKFVNPTAAGITPTASEEWRGLKFDIERDQDPSAYT